MLGPHNNSPSSRLRSAIRAITFANALQKVKTSELSPDGPNGELDSTPLSPGQHVLASEDVSVDYSHMSTSTNDVDRFSTVERSPNIWSTNRLSGLDSTEPSNRQFIDYTDRIAQEISSKSQIHESEELFSKNLESEQTNSFKRKVRDEFVRSKTEVKDLKAKLRTLEEVRVQELNDRKKLEETHAKMKKALRGVSNSSGNFAVAEDPNVSEKAVIRHQESLKNANKEIELWKAKFRRVEEAQKTQETNLRMEKLNASTEVLRFRTRCEKVRVKLVSLLNFKDKHALLLEAWRNFLNNAQIGRKWQLNETAIMLHTKKETKDLASTSFVKWKEHVLIVNGLRQETKKFQHRKDRKILLEAFQALQHNMEEEFGRLHKAISIATVKFRSAVISSWGAFSNESILLKRNFSKLKVCLAKLMILNVVVIWTTWILRLKRKRKAKEKGMRRNVSSKRNMLKEGLTAFSKLAERSLHQRQRRKTIQRGMSVVLVKRSFNVWRETGHISKILHYTTSRVSFRFHLKDLFDKWKKGNRTQMTDRILNFSAAGNRSVLVTNLSKSIQKAVFKNAWFSWGSFAALCTRSKYIAEQTANLKRIRNVRKSFDSWLHLFKMQQHLQERFLKEERQNINGTLSACLSIWIQRVSNVWRTNKIGSIFKIKNHQKLCLSFFRHWQYFIYHRRSLIVSVSHQMYRAHTSRLTDVIDFWIHATKTNSSFTKRASDMVRNRLKMLCLKILRSWNVWNLEESIGQHKFIRLLSFRRNHLQRGYFQLLAHHANISISRRVLTSRKVAAFARSGRFIAFRTWRMNLERLQRKNNIARKISFVCWKNTMQKSWLSWKADITRIRWLKHRGRAISGSIVHKLMDLMFRIWVDSNRKQQNRALPFYSDYSMCHPAQPKLSKRQHPTFRTEVGNFLIKSEQRIAKETTTSWQKFVTNASYRRKIFVRAALAVKNGLLRKSWKSWQGKVQDLRSSRSMASNICLKKRIVSAARVFQAWKILLLSDWRLSQNVVKELQTRGLQSSLRMWSAWTHRVSIKKILQIKQDRLAAKNTQQKSHLLFVFWSQQTFNERKGRDKLENLIRRYAELILKKILKVWRRRKGKDRLMKIMQTKYVNSKCQRRGVHILVTWLNIVQLGHRLVYLRQSLYARHWKCLLQKCLQEWLEKTTNRAFRHQYCELLLKQITKALSRTMDIWIQNRIHQRVLLGIERNLIVRVQQELLLQGLRRWESACQICGSGVLIRRQMFCFRSRSQRALLRQNLAEWVGKVKRRNQLRHMLQTGRREQLRRFLRRNFNSWSCTAQSNFLLFKMPSSVANVLNTAYKRWMARVKSIAEINERLKCVWNPYNAELSLQSICYPDGTIHEEDINKSLNSAFVGKNRAQDPQYPADLRAAMTLIRSVNLAIRLRRAAIIQILNTWIVLAKRKQRMSQQVQYFRKRQLQLISSISFHRWCHDCFIISERAQYLFRRNNVFVTRNVFKYWFTLSCAENAQATRVGKTLIASEYRKVRAIWISWQKHTMRSLIKSNSVSRAIGPGYSKFLIACIEFCRFHPLATVHPSFCVKAMLAMYKLRTVILKSYRCWQAMIVDAKKRVWMENCATRFAYQAQTKVVFSILYFYYMNKRRIRRYCSCLLRSSQFWSVLAFWKMWRNCSNKILALRRKIQILGQRQKISSLNSLFSGWCCKFSQKSTINDFLAKTSNFFKSHKLFFSSLSKYRVDHGHCLLQGAFHITRSGTRCLRRAFMALMQHVAKHRSIHLAFHKSTGVLQRNLRKLLHAVWSGWCQAIAEHPNFSRVDIGVQTLNSRVTWKEPMEFSPTLSSSILKTSVNIPAVPRYAGVGMFLMRLGSELRPIVHRLIDRGPAAQSGLIRLGDMLLRINGVEVTSLTLEEIAHSIGGREGTYVDLVVWRTGALSSSRAGYAYKVKLCRTFVPSLVDGAELEISM